MSSAYLGNAVDCEWDRLQSSWECVQVAPFINCLGSNVRSERGGRRGGDGVLKRDVGGLSNFSGVTLPSFLGSEGLTCAGR